MKNIITLLFLSFVFSCKGQEEQQMKIEIYQEQKMESNNLKNNINQNKEIQTMKFTDIKKQSYYIFSNANHISYEILVNDYPVYKYYYDEKTKPFRLRANIPINNGLLKSGKHNIKGKCYPMNINKTLDNNAFLGLEFKIGESGTLNYLNLYEITSPYPFLNKDQTSLINPISGLPYFEVETELNVELPFNLVGWTESIDLKKELDEGKNLKNELKLTYDKIRQIIENKDVSSFSDLIKEREELLAVSFYFTKDEQKKELEEFLELIKNPDYELVPYPSEANLHFYGYGKLVTLLTKEREGIIKLINKKDPNEEITLDFYFHRKQKNSELKVIM